MPVSSHGVAAAPAPGQPSPPHEGGRGRSADSPSDIPVPGWKDILLRVYQNISRHHLIAIAAGVTFYTLLAIFPAIAALVALYGLFADPGTITSQLDQVSGFLPGGAIDVVPHGKLMLTVLGGLAEFERSLIVARTGEGRTRAKAKGVQFGRPLKLNAHQRQEALARLNAGETQADIARTYGVNATTIGRLAP